jgi:hypothetical protein
MKDFAPCPKPRTLVSPALRQSARGRPCAVRWSVACDGSGETTVLAHLRKWSGAGVAQKGDDTFAVFACAACHDCIDGRRGGDVPEAELLRALRETQSAWLTDGLLTVKGAKC